ncbi:MAG TPA: ARMT1-like domain-containing protein [Prolixibacteraceae bacterium]|nr:ARMT1-like domain-containing protein [Prolixibacteraceae bacterium]
MISDYRCFFCFARAFEKLLEEEKLTVAEKNSFTRGMAMLYSKLQEDFSAPAFSRELHQVLKLYSKNTDPYLEIKKQSNDRVLALYPTLKKLVLESANPFDTALRLAIAGNIIDFGVSNQYDLDATIDKVLKSDFSINHSYELKEALSNAKTVLYLGDNSGEIVLDKLFIETIMHPNLHFAVRGAPVINDVTIDDARYVGIYKVADVISNGYDAPSTIIDKCSEEFQKHFNDADVIISKGQGNLEGLLHKTHKTVFFLLMVKCDVIAEALGVKKGDFVVMKNIQK